MLAGAAYTSPVRLPTSRAGLTSCMPQPRSACFVYLATNRGKHLSLLRRHARHAGKGLSPDGKQAQGPHAAGHRQLVHI